MNIQIQSEGRRHYITGDTYPIKEAIRSAGCKWDRDRGAWWTGKLETALDLTEKVKAGAVKIECSWRKVGSDFAVAVPSDLAAKTGDKVTVRKASGDTKQVTLGAEIQPGLFSVARDPRATPATPRPSLKLVGDQTDLVSDYEASKHNRAPHRTVGEVCWLSLTFGDVKRPLAVVVVGYQPATYYRANEDFGDYSERRGYFGRLFYRAATREEHDALQVTTPRETAIAPEEWEAK